jgi:hypothetical protein
MVKALVICVLLALCACASPAPVHEAVAIWCDHNEPRRVSAEVISAMSDQELRELIAYNRQGEEWCGWKP